MDQAKAFFETQKQHVMTWVAVVLVPIILLYTAWCYWKMFGRITKEDIERNTHSLY